MPCLELIWSPYALMGVQRAYHFLAGKDLDAAKIAARTIRKHATLLKKFPNAGRTSDDLEPEQRELLIPFGASGYVLVYEMYAQGILILAVRHQKESGY